MKSTTILCLALPLFILGTALSLVVYARDLNESSVLTAAQHGMSQSSMAPGQAYNGSAPAVQAAVYVSSSPIETGLARGASGTGPFSGLPNAALLAGKKELEPAAIFLFGAGIAGLASFTRRKLNV